MTNQEITTVRLIVNADQATKQLEKINADLARTQELRKAALDRGDEDAWKGFDKTIERLTKQQDRLLARSQLVEKTLRDIDKATPKELRATIRAINREFERGNIERGSQEWNALTKALRETRTELQRVENEAKASRDALDEGSTALSRWGARWVGVTTIFDQVSGWFDTARAKMEGYVQDYAEMAEHMNQVTKYTGLSAEDVRELNEAFKQMDTRTPREKLNDLAGDAGRLGITSKQQILDFVDAANQINVALGEDLGEDAVKNIGKLAQLFGDDDRLGLKQAMLSTGSVINALAQSSSASEGYLMDFTARLAGVGHQAFPPNTSATSEHRSPPPLRRRGTPRIPKNPKVCPASFHITRRLEVSSFPQCF